MEFRFKALRHAHDPDDLDVTVNLAHPRSWIIVFVTLVLLLAAALWAFLGNLPQTVTGMGVLSRPDGVIRVQTAVGGTVTSTTVAVGDPVATAQLLATVVDPSGASHQVVAPSAATIMVADVRPGMVVATGDELFVLERTAPVDTPLVAVVAVPAGAAAALSPGLPVTLNVSAAPARSFGLLTGTVSAVSGFPVTRVGLSTAVFDDTTIAQMLATGQVDLVEIALTRNPATPSGFAWTSVAGPPFPLEFQTGVTAEIRIGDRRPIDLVFGGST